MFKRLQKLVLSMFDQEKRMSKYVSLMEFLSILEELVPMLDNSECPSKFSTNPYQSGYRSAVHCVQVFVREGYVDFFDKEDAPVRYIREEAESA